MTAEGEELDNWESLGIHPHSPKLAKFRQLLPYLLQNKALIAVVVVLSIVGSLATVAQPLLVRQGITNFQAHKPFTAIGVLVLVLLVLGREALRLLAQAGPTSVAQ